MTRPELVLVTTSYPSRGDGSEAAGAFVADLVDALRVHVEVRIVAPGAHAAAEAAGEGVQVHRYAAGERPLSTLRPWHPVDAVAIARVMRSGLAATRAAVSPRTRHLFALWALPSGHWARRVAREAGVPYSTWTLGSDVWSLGRLPLVRGVLARVLREARHCFSDGLQLAEDTRRLAGGREVQFLPSTRRIAAPSAPAPAGAPPYRFAFLGRWHANKGVDLLLEALHALDDADWQCIARFDIAGGGPLQAQVGAAVARLQERGRPVALHGFLDKPAAVEMVSGADWLVIPSRIESIPVVFSDAVKLGRAVVATPVGDLPALVDGAPACGVVAASVDAGAIAAALREALARPAAGFAAGIAARAAQFDLDRVAATVAGLARDE